MNPIRPGCASWASHQVSGWHSSTAYSTRVKQGKISTHQDLLDFLVVTLHMIFDDVLEDVLPVFKSVHGLVGVRVQD